MNVGCELNGKVSVLGWTLSEARNLLDNTCEDAIVVTKPAVRGRMARGL